MWLKMRRSWIFIQAPKNSFSDIIMLLYVYTNNLLLVSAMSLPVAACLYYIIMHYPTFGFFLGETHPFSGWYVATTLPPRKTTKGGVDRPCPAPAGVDKGRVCPIPNNDHAVEVEWWVWRLYNSPTSSVRPMSSTPLLMLFFCICTLNFSDSSYLV